MFSSIAGRQTRGSRARNQLIPGPANGSCQDPFRSMVWRGSIWRGFWTHPLDRISFASYSSAVTDLVRFPAGRAAGSHGPVITAVAALVCLLIVGAGHADAEPPS